MSRKQRNKRNTAAIVKSAVPQAEAFTFDDPIPMMIDAIFWIIWNAQ